jgi:glutamate N-acetyltransferase/amino-acid N-acetyltransferase
MGVLSSKKGQRKEQEIKMPVIDGVKFATIEAGIKYKGRADVFLAAFTPKTVVAGVFTKSKCASAAIDWCKANLSKGIARGLLVNSGNANAFTGKKGREAVELSAKFVAKSLGCKKREIFLASTGVIGEPLDANLFDVVLGELVGGLKSTPWVEPAKAIMTTDTYPKLASKSIKIDGVEVRISGIAKGSGMIAPDMATMLSFIFTDVAISKDILQKLLNEYVQDSFNSISVDSDTSTSDTVLVFATGKAANSKITSLDDARVKIFGAALGEVLFDLAMAVVRDGEGASKLIKIAVSGAKGDKSAKKIAFSIANSPLVKTAIAGEDANWGRVVMAVGKAGEPANRDKMSIYFGDIKVAENGEVVPNYSEENAAKYMKNPEIEIGVDVGVAKGRAVVYTCDLTHEYISINADYRS